MGCGTMVSKYDSQKECKSRVPGYYVIVITSKSIHVTYRKGSIVRMAANVKMCSEFNYALMLLTLVVLELRNV